MDKLPRCSSLSMESLFGSDTASPYAVNLEINATGHFEVYAVARDNMGNISTSNVGRTLLLNRMKLLQNRLPLLLLPQLIWAASLLSQPITSRRPRMYDPAIYALVYVDGIFTGMAETLPYDPPEAGVDDPGQSFAFDLSANTIGSQEVEFVIVNGAVTATSKQPRWKCPPTHFWTTPPSSSIFTEVCTTVHPAELRTDLLGTATFQWCNDPSPGNRGTSHS